MARAEKEGADRETYAVRLSARTTRANFDKMVALAEAKGWLNAHGNPNISKVLNHILGRFRVPKEKKRG
jgi:hypothetical protein